MELPLAPQALPPAGDTSTRTLRKKARLRALRWLLTARVADARLAARLGLVREALQAGLKTTPATVLAAVDPPEVLGPLLCAEAGVANADRIVLDTTPQLLANLGLARKPLRPPRPLVWDLPMPPLLVGTCLVRGIQALYFDGAELQVQREEGRRPLRQLARDQVLHPLDRGMALTTWDTNPLAMQEDHPDKQGNALSLGGRPLATWVGALREALLVIRAALPEVAAELPWVAQRLVPVGFDAEKHLSASYREVPGLMYLTLHPDVLTMAEAIVHESQHSKLNLLSLEDQVLVNGRTAWTESPVRPDLRPLMGVMLAAHAFVPVAALHARLDALDHPLSRAGHFAQRRAEVLDSNARGLAVLREQGDFTPAGATVMSALEALDGALRQ